MTPQQRQALDAVRARGGASIPNIAEDLRVGDEHAAALLRALLRLGELRRTRRNVDGRWRKFYQLAEPKPLHGRAPNMACIDDSWASNG